MKTHNSNPIDNYQDLLGQRIAARLSEAALSLPNDLSERLKVARMQALSKRKIVKLQMTAGVNLDAGGATLTAGNPDGGRWSGLGALVPLLALVAGLLTIAVVQEQRRANELAEVDVELLADELPPSAYTDPGFVHFLNTNRRD